jgi:hypothetical protein
MLYPSQEVAQESLRHSLSTHEISILQGLSGSGKSLVAEDVMADGDRGIIMECGEVNMTNLDRIKDAITAKLRVVLLAQPETDFSYIHEHVSADTGGVHMRSLSAADVETWMNGVQPELSPDERDCILEYSLGIPLLIDVLCKTRPITRTSALPKCAVYLQTMIETSFLAGSDYKEKLQTILADYTDFVVPTDVLAMLAEHRMTRGTNTPLSLLHTKLSPEKELPMPSSEQLLDVYAQWLEHAPKEPSVNIFVPNMPEPKQVLMEIGFSDEANEKTSLLSTFLLLSNLQKGTTFYAEPGLPFMQQMSTFMRDNYIDDSLTTMARTSGVTVTLKRSEFNPRRINVNVDSATALFLHKHEHTQNEVMPVAYTVECYLQQKGIAYTVQYNEKMFRYDPTLKTYEPLTVEKVDCWKEIFDKEDASENP